MLAALSYTCLVQRSECSSRLHRGRSFHQWARAEYPRGLGPTCKWQGCQDSVGMVACAVWFVFNHLYIIIDLWMHMCQMCEARDVTQHRTLGSSPSSDFCKTFAGLVSTSSLGGLFVWRGGGGRGLMAHTQTRPHRLGGTGGTGDVLPLSQGPWGTQFRCICRGDIQS